MAKDKIIRFQIPTTSEQRGEVKEYAAKLGVTVNELFINSYRFFRRFHGGNPKEDKKISVCLEGFFNVPDGISPRMFISLLYMLQVRYPNASALGFWTPIYYTHAENYTHKEVFEKIRGA